VLDPFCGSGTTIAAAQTRSRRWIGIDQNCVAIDLVTQRLRDTFQLEPERDYATIRETAPPARARRRRPVTARRNL